MTQCSAETLLRMLLLELIMVRAPVLENAICKQFILNMPVNSCLKVMNTAQDDPAVSIVEKLQFKDEMPYMPLSAFRSFSFDLVSR